ncbi:ATP-grasp domain-containing protein [Streptomyces sp. URMC 123]|uniref:ATP-grasp domain-containing protein n=1 Tax=Streptomyces sp. URMC 123 TaxID=3423403 RepID=UPI003F1BC66B
MCLLTPKPDHPLLAATTELLAARHTVRWLDPTAADEHLTALMDDGPPPDVCLLKARTPRALALARRLERRGVPVLNSAAATELCQDRTAMAEVARAAGLPFAATETFATLTDCAAVPVRRPVVVKSRHSRRGDLVARVDGPAALRPLLAAWPDEPVVVQDFVPNNGWDLKLWAVGERVFAAERRSELATASGAPGPARTVPLDELPAALVDLVHRVGEVFALDVYGVDVLDPAGTPLIVDINAFPGIRGQSGAPEALAALTLRTAAAGVAGAAAAGVAARSEAAGAAGTGRAALG